MRKGSESQSKTNIWKSIFRAAEEAFREKLMDEAAAEGLEIEGNQSRYDQTEEEAQDKETFDDWAERIAEEYERKRKVYAEYWGHTKHAPKRTATGTIFNVVILLRVMSRDSYNLIAFVKWVKVVWLLVNVTRKAENDEKNKKESSTWIIRNVVWKIISRLRSVLSP